MMLRFNRPLLLLTVILIIITGTSCTKKKNLTGNNWSGIAPITVTSDSLYTNAFSYTAEESEYKVNGTETTLICGSDEGIAAAAFIQFTDIPDSITIAGQPVLKLVATRRSPLSRNPLILTFFKINKEWSADSTSLVTDSDLMGLSFDAFTVQDTISTSGDTLQINIPANIITTLKKKSAVGFNLAIKTVHPDTWLEFKALESANGALLTFNYQSAKHKETTEYSKRTSKDSHRITGIQTAVTNGVWKIKNLLPQRLYIKFAVPDNLFKDKDNNVLSNTDRRRMTINKAELVLYAKDNHYYDKTLLYLFPFNVTADTLSTPRVIVKDELQVITHSYSSVKKTSEDFIKLDITAIMQGYTSGDLNNNGIVVKCISEALNFGKIEFWTDADDTPDDKKPYIKIIYTPPFL